METKIYRVLGFLMLLFGWMIDANIVFDNKNYSMNLFIAGAGLIVLFFPPSEKVTIDTPLEIIKNKFLKNKPEAESETKI